MKIGKEAEPVEVPEPQFPDFVPEKMPPPVKEPAPAAPEPEPVKP